jgi:hypothetical protein
MKNLKQITSSLLILILLLTLTGCPTPSKCSQETCTSYHTDLVRSVNFFDFNSNSIYYNQSVATFKFTQTRTTYSAPNECSTCPSEGFNTALLLTNQTNKVIHFDYNVSFLLNFASWNYQGVATINPLATLSVGEISTNPASITLGQITLQSASITYQ